MEKEKFKTTIGGQAVMEGVMMRGPEKVALSVRLPDGTIDTETWSTEKAKWYSKVPLLRGTFNFVGSMKLGYKCLALSATKSGLDEEEEESKFEKMLKEKFGDKFMNVVMGIAAILGVLIAVLLFTWLPVNLANWTLGAEASKGMRSLVEGIIRIVIFVLYIWLVSKMEDIYRVFQFHGAEHKSITCYEMGDELTPENAAKHTRLHPRCGTSFILISLVVSIILFSLIPAMTPLLRTVLKIALLPAVLGISYEIIRLAGRYNNIFTRIISFPGLMLQKMTTKEPDEKQLEVAIASLKAAMPEKEGSDRY